MADPGERGAWSEMAADRDLIRESFEKQPVRTVAEACERTLSTQRSGTEIGDAVRNHVVVPAVVFARSDLESAGKLFQGVPGA